MKRRNVDMINGSLLAGIWWYSLPLIATGLLQLLYNAADMIVVARWAGGTALAAVGSIGPLINLIINVFIGLATGASVIVSRAFGAGNPRDVQKSVHCAMAVSAISGVVTMLIGLLVVEQALIWMGTPADVIGQATLYLRIYFLGMPAMMVYNFGAAILRAVGDTKRPLYILAVAGLINVLLNLLLVIVFHMDVAGVAIATTVSQIFSAVMVVIVLRKADGPYRYHIRKTRIYKEILFKMLRYGIPAGIQSSVFSASNILIQSSINSFGSAAISGNAAAANLEGFTYVAMNSVCQACMSFTAQNMGARKPERLRPILFTSLSFVTVIGLLMGSVLYLFGEPLLTMYTAASSTETTISSGEILYYGMQRFRVIAVTHFLCGIMEVLANFLRGMGASWTPTIVTIAGVCGIRVMWIFTVFRYVDHSLKSLFLSYTISWLITAAIHALCCIVKYRKSVRELTAQKT